MTTSTLLLAALLAAAAPSRADVDGPPEPTPTPGRVVPAPTVRPALSEQSAAEFEAQLRASPLGKGIAPVPGGLTGDMVADRSVEVAPSVELRELQIERAAVRLDQTIVSFLPQLNLRAGYTRLSKAAINFGGTASVIPTATSDTVAPYELPVTPCADPAAGQCAQGLLITPPFKIEIPLNSYSLTAQLSVPISDYILSLTPARKGPIAARESAELARDAERIKVKTDARLAYYNWLRAVAALIVLEDALVRTEARRTDVQNLFDAGAATRSDVLRVEALVSAQQAAINDARTLRNVLERSLSVMMKEPPRAFEVGEDLLAPPRDIGRLPQLDEMIEEALQSRLEVRSLQRAIDGIEQGIKATRAGYYPRLDAVADATYANPNQRFFPLSAVWRGSWSAGVQISYSINSTLRTKATVREYKADKREMIVQAEQMRRGITMEVAQAYGDRIRAIQAIELNTRGLASSAEAYRVASENYAAGAATTNEIIDAEGDQIQAGLRAISAHIDLRVANTRLLYATGRLNPEASKSARK